MKYLSILFLFISTLAYGQQMELTCYSCENLERVNCSGCREHGLLSNDDYLGFTTDREFRIDSVAIYARNTAGSTRNEALYLYTAGDSLLTQSDQTVAINPSQTLTLEYTFGSGFTVPPGAYYFDYGTTASDVRISVYFNNSEPNLSEIYWVNSNIISDPYIAIIGEGITPGCTE